MMKWQAPPSEPLKKCLTAESAEIAEMKRVWNEFAE
jgi:hypothetical protein